MYPRHCLERVGAVGDSDQCDSALWGIIRIIEHCRQGWGRFSEEDRIFEKIFLRLQQSSEMAIRTLPSVNSHFVTAMKISDQQSRPDQPTLFWQILVRNAPSLCRQQTPWKLVCLWSSLSARNQDSGGFLELCNAFIHVGYWYRCLNSAFWLLPGIHRFGYESKGSQKYNGSPVDGRHYSSPASSKGHQRNFTVNSNIALVIPGCPSGV